MPVVWSGRRQQRTNDFKLSVSNLNRAGIVSSGRRREFPPIAGARAGKAQETAGILAPWSKFRHAEKKIAGPAEFANFDRRLALPPWRKNSLPAPVVVAAMGGSRSVFSVPCSAPSLLRVSASPREPSSRWPGFPRSRKIRPRPRPPAPPSLKSQASGPRGEIFATAFHAKGEDDGNRTRNLRIDSPTVAQMQDAQDASLGPAALGPSRAKTDAREAANVGAVSRGGWPAPRRPINPSRRQNRQPGRRRALWQRIRKPPCGSFGPSWFRRRRGHAHRPCAGGRAGPGRRPRRTRLAGAGQQAGDPAYVPKPKAKGSRETRGCGGRRRLNPAARGGFFPSAASCGGRWPRVIWKASGRAGVLQRRGP